MQTSAWVALAGTLAVTGGLLLFPKDGTGARFQPKPGEVLERVGAVEARQRRTAEEAAAEAQALISASRAKGGDVRLLGRAQAVLAPWWNEASPPAPVRLMRATIKQSLHDFDGALVDLDALAEAAQPDSNGAGPAQPDSNGAGPEPQARLTQATVLMVVGRHEDAERACLSLTGKVPEGVIAGCVAPVWAIRGKTKEGIAALETALRHTRPDDPLRSWLESELGELLVWSGELNEGATALRRALQLDPKDGYSRLLLAATLTELARPEEAVRLFSAPSESNDAELLQLVLSATAAQHPETKVWEAMLQERVEASRRRGDGVHRREESRFALRVEGEPAIALKLATKNFEVQREPADVRVLLEAALAAKDRRAAEPALAWMKQTGFGDPRLTTLADAVESLP